MGALAAEGINSFKFFMAYKGVFQVDDLQLLRGFQRCKQLGALPQVHLSASPPPPGGPAPHPLCMLALTQRGHLMSRSIPKLNSRKRGMKLPEPLACSDTHQSPDLS